MNQLTPLGAIVRGLVAGTVGLVAMDTLLYVRYRREGGKTAAVRWEFSADVKTWDQAPAPAQAIDGGMVTEALLAPTSR